MKTLIKAEGISQLIEKTVEAWHQDSENRAAGCVITDEMKRIRPLNEHREDLREVIEELVVTNTEIWHEEDKVRSDIDQTVLRAIRNINPLNQHRNDLIEEIDEILMHAAKEGE